MNETLLETEIEIRSGESYQVADVNFPKRIVTVVAMPYESPTVVPYGDRVVTEVVSRGAFNGIEQRAGKIRANRDHSWDKLVGKIIGLHPSRKEGLVAEVRMFQTPLGERTLQECDEGGLDASAGFYLLRREDGRVWEDAEVWEHNSTVRRLNRIRLDHLAFVPNPAYPDANVLSVRDNQRSETVGSTPNLDRLAHEELRARFEELDQRWPH